MSSSCGRNAAGRLLGGDFPLPLPTRCRECRKRKRAAARYRADCCCVPGLIIVRARSVTGEAIALLGSAESAGGVKIDGEALVRALLAYKRGEPRVCAMVRTPTPRRKTAADFAVNARR